MKKAIGFLLFVLIANFTLAQQITHKVEPKETMYGISKQYGVSQDQIINANPFLSERGLQIGDELVIPGKKKADGSIKAVVTTVEQPQVVIPKEDADFIYLKIAPKQTLYSISKEYKVSETALKSLNPQLENGLKTGDVIRIPKKKNQEEVTPEGMYKVQKSDTVYGLSQQFGVSQEEFYISNPNTQKEGLIVGSYINIPKKTTKAAVIQDGFIEHTVKAGETIYSIAKMYKVSFGVLMENNPALADGLKVGMVLKIPVSDNLNIVKVGKIKRKSDNEINIALVLPFYLNNPSGNAQEKEISTDLLIGSKVALDSLARKGKKINLTVLDSDNQAASIENMLAQNDFSKFDAVIGPLFASNFKSLAEMLNGSGIALVSPLSNADDLKDYENVIIPTPSDKAIADAVIEEIKANYKGQKIQILTDDRNKDLAEYVSANLKKSLGADTFVTQDVNQLVQQSETVDEKFSDGSIVKTTYFTPLITVLVSDNNALGSAYVSKIIKMDAENLQAYGVKFVSAYDIYNEKNKSNIAALKNIGFSFGTVRLVNVYGNNERNTLEKFLNVYCVMPNEYQQIGFDVMYDLVDRMNAGGDVLNALGNEQTRLSTKFKYEKSGKAYLNKSVRIIRLFVPQDESPDDVEEIKD